MKDNWNAFITKDFILEPTGTGVLDGLTFAIKDVFDIQGYKSTAGNPDWYRTHSPGKRNAPVIEILLSNGARLMGTTHTDELMYSLNGENSHYGTPVNPNAPNRIPGGSSSGSAVAAAAGMVNFSIGTDTGGSVRIPASYCGIYGFRPTHGMVNIDGVIPLAKSFDTVGWMSKDLNTLLKVGEVFLDHQAPAQDSFSYLYFEEEAWTFIEEESKMILLQAASVLEDMGSIKQSLKISTEGLTQWAELFRYIQGIQIWKEHGAWIEQEHPVFGPGIAERFTWTSTLKERDLPALMEKKKIIRQRLSTILKDNGLLVIPTSPGEAPLRHLQEEKREQHRTRTMQLTCIAGLAGFPQITVPFKNQNGVPIGLSFIANRNQDLHLIKWVHKLIEASGGFFCFPDK
ncbi:amidase [Niallia endozanthoxylica]|uniref:Amidase n=1 Tax=Niallia endozanthoxylica TaxID=2036016 RepID=A0A5J5I3V8_9BACI|nr:amidase [Niallia endozanthoxylica]KAA9028576.1 amidase [Niallia endozanthoxylica]